MSNYLSELRKLSEGSGSRSTLSSHISDLIYGHLNQVSCVDPQYILLLIEKRLYH